MEKTSENIEGIYLLEKYPGKGGWTYVLIPEIAQDKTAPFGWVQVSGRIDHYSFEKIKLMPSGDGKLFLPVKAAIRKLIRKEAGDTVNISIWKDQTPFNIPQEIVDSLNLAGDHLLNHFQELPSTQQKKYIDAIHSAKTDETKVKLIVKMIKDLS